MAEFDANAFSVVDNYFVIDKEGVSQEETTKKNTTTTTKSHSAGKDAAARRLGVGASSKPTPPPTGNKNDAASRILKVGTKKRGLFSQGIGDNHEDELVVGLEDENGQADDDDEEEEPGRTGIATEHNATNRNNTLGIDRSSEETKGKKKKKAGKKERQKGKEEEEKETTNVDEPSSESLSSQKDVNDPVTSEKSVEKEDQQEHCNNDTKPKENRKRKRRKIRSRQKNIYKDNRAPDAKPTHLLPGGYEYLGRPMTAETRAKLQAKGGLPMPSLSAEKDPDAFREVWEDGESGNVDNGVPVLSSEESLTQQKKQEKKTSETEKKDKRKKKSKYKNFL